MFPADDSDQLPLSAELPTLFFVGDSTVHIDSSRQRGWADEIINYFEFTVVNVAVRAIAGRSSRTFLTQGDWLRVLGEIKPGDFVFIQFGHNDGDPIGEDDKRRGSLPGAGNESREVVDPATGQVETVHTYGWYLRRYIANVRELGATPIVCSPVPRLERDGDSIKRVALTYSAWAAEAARSNGAVFLDLNDIVARRYEAMSPAAVDQLFDDDRVHTNRAGAQVNAECVVAGLNRLDGRPFASFFSTQAASVEPAGLQC